jgi:hypothetical protein
MQKIFLSILFLILVISTNTAKAQEEENEYGSENVFGVNLNTNAGLIGGAMYRHAKELKRGRYLNFGVEIVNVKHPNEVRYPNGTTGNVYILGKKNYLFALRPQIGYEFVLFTKGKEDGIQVDAIINGGPSIGIVKPYYIQYLDSNQISIMPYNSNLQDAAIVGPGGFFHGFDRIRFVPGLHLKTGLSFEFGSFGSGVSGIEVGNLTEAYTQRIDILDISSSFPTYNRWFFTSLYVNIFFGGRR